MSESQDVVRELFAAINRGDIDAVLALVDPRIELHPSAWSGGGTAYGVDGVRRWLEQFGTEVDQLQLEVVALEGEGDRVLALGTAYDLRGDRRYAQQLGWVFELDDGLIFRTRSYENWEEARRAL